MASKKISKAIGGTATRRTAGALPRLKAADRRSPLAVLRAARELLSVKERWTKGVFARNANGREVQATSEVATCWCASGALRAVSGGTYSGSGFFGAYDRLAKQIRCRDVPSYNDAETRRHRHVLAWFDRAIARASKKEV